jgi:hypothetical protein
VRLDDGAPDWIRRGTGASISFYRTATNPDFFGWEQVTTGLLHEVTVCSSRTKPIEPVAKVLTIQDEEPAPARVRAVSQPVRGQQWAIGHRPRNGREEMDELRAREALAERAGLPVNVEAIIHQLRADLGYGSSVPWWRQAA